MRKRTIWNRNFIIVWMSTFLLFTVFYSLLSSLPIYVIDTLHGGGKESGLVISIFIIASVLFRPLSGKWLDQYGKKKVLVLSFLLFFASSFLYLIVQNLTQLIILRFIHGISFGVASTATGAIAADILPDRKKGEGIGYYALSYNTAIFVGPFLGLTLINQFNYSVYFIVLTGISCLSFLIASNIRIHTLPLKQQKEQEIGSIWNKLIEIKAVPVSFTAMFIAIAFSGFLTYIPLYASKLDLSSMAGYFYLIYAAAIILLRPVTGKIFDQFNEHLIIYSGIVLFTLGLIFLSLAQSAFVFLLAAAIIGAGFSGLTPSLQAIAVKSTSSNRSGQATATYFTFFDIGVGLGSFLLGIIVSGTSFSMMYLSSAMIVVFSSVIYYFLYHRQKLSIDTKEHMNI